MRRIGFTLIELLVVITAISLLMAILIPALRLCREQARTVLCGSNIRQLLLGLIAYETENQSLPFAFNDTDMNPPPGGWPGYLQYDRMGWWWFNYMEGFFNNADRKRTVLLCPSKHLTDIKLKGNILCGNYGVNQSLCKSARGRMSRAEFIGAPLSTTDLPRPAQTLLIVDSGYSMINWWHVTETPPVTLGRTIEDAAYIPGLRINKERTNLWSGHQSDAIDGRHQGKTVNIGFADGRIGRKKADILLVEKTGGTYKNRLPLWVPE